MSQCLVLAVVLTVIAKDVLVSSDAISQKTSQKGTGSRLGLRRATKSVDLAWLLRFVSPTPGSHESESCAEDAIKSTIFSTI